MDFCHTPLPSVITADVRNIRGNRGSEDRGKVPAADVCILKFDAYRVFTVSLKTDWFCPLGPTCHRLALQKRSNT